MNTLPKPTEKAGTEMNEPEPDVTVIHEYRETTPPGWQRWLTTRDKIRHIRSGEAIATIDRTYDFIRRAEQNALSPQQPPKRSEGDRLLREAGYIPDQIVFPVSIFFVSRSIDSTTDTIRWMCRLCGHEEEPTRPGPRYGVDHLIDTHGAIFIGGTPPNKHSPAWQEYLKSKTVALDQKVETGNTSS